MAFESPLRFFFVKEPNEASHKPHEEQNGGGEYICFASWPGENIDKKREDGEREQQRGEWVEE
ncbi:hypothetical protein [Collinsella bouchesdurhonensis]|jgi:hypothetical protein|uniref:hypothetical protein n=1 Tax=Collinsella bouchesdurhonensis TaxID=1907654 RepID=UPI0034A5A6C0